MKLLFTTHQFFPEYSAGTEVLTRSVARRLIELGHQVHVFSGHPAQQDLPGSPQLEQYSLEGIHVYRFHHANAYTTRVASNIALGYDNHMGAGLFGEVLESYRPDVVHFFHFHRLGTGLIEQVVQRGIPAYFTPTDFWAICATAQLVIGDGSLCAGPDVYGGNCIKHIAQAAKSTRDTFQSRVVQFLPTAAVNAVSRLTQLGLLPPYPNRSEVLALGSRLQTNVRRLNQLHRITAPNRAMRDVLVTFGIEPEKVVELTYGIDAPHLLNASERASVGSPLRIGFIGSLAPHKGCQVLVDAFKQLPPGRAVLKIFGDPEEFPSYFAKLKQSSRGTVGVSFCGTFPNDSISKVLADLDVLVVPSIWPENTPLVLYSAHAACCPVVASNFGGLSAVIVHNFNGLLFEPGNARALVVQVQRLLDEPELINTLRINIPRPKPMEQYVDELLSMWGDSTIKSDGHLNQVT